MFFKFSNKCQKEILRCTPSSHGCNFLNKVPSPRPVTLLKKRFQHRCFPVDIFHNTYFEEHLQTAASTGVLLEFCKDTFCNLQFTFFICNLATTQFWLWKYKFYLEFLSVNFKNIAVHNSIVRLNFHVLLCIRPIFQNFSSPLHLSILQHLSIIWSHLFLHRCLSLCFFTCSLQMES